MYVFLKISFLFLFSLVISTISVGAQQGWMASHGKNGGDLIAVYFTSSEKGWIGGDGGYLAYTDDGGKSWIPQSLGMNETINEIYFRNDDNGYIVAGKRMFITKDGGRTWQGTRIYDPNNFKNTSPEFLSIRFTGRKNGWVIGSVFDKNDDVVDSLVMQTDDGGESWRRGTVPFKGELYHLDFVGDDYGWIVGAAGTILATDDGGRTWRKQKSGTTKDLYNVDFRDKDEGYIVGSKGVILRTDDGGATWQIVRTSFPMTFMRVNFADDNNGWIVGYSGTILRSSDKGRTWIKQESRSSDHLYGLFMNKKIGWAVGAKGAIIEYRR